MVFIRDVPFRHFPNETLHFDLYQPDEEEEVPLVLFFHGGSYTHGSRKDINPRLAQTFVDNGFAIASVEYRLAPKVTITEMLDDCRFAVNWMISNLDGCGLDLRRVGAWGYSAGARFASLLGAMGEVDAVCHMFGSVDFSVFGTYGDAYQHIPEERALTMFGQANPIKELVDIFNPIHHLHKHSAAFLLIHGENDTQSPIDQSERFYSALEKKRLEAQFLVLEDAAHDLPDRYLPSVSAAMLSFFDKHLR